MQLVLKILAVLTILELLLWSPLLWRWHKAVSSLIAAAQVAAVLALVIVSPRSWAVVLAFFSLYRVINLLRLAKERIHLDFLYHAARKTSVWLVCLQLAVLAVVWLGGRYGVDILAWLYLLAAAQLFAGAILLVSTARHLKTTRPPKVAAHYADSELPSLTVAIPARNETDDLEACLRSLIGSNYPKLEIIVLDDCSQTRRTPEIIRGFAHDGVRFIAGDVPPSHWLAKNYAYSKLAASANGDLLLFCGVDVRFEPNSLNELVKTMLKKKKSMLSLLPRNFLPEHGNVFRLLIQPNRYAWELALPRRLLQRPPVLSTCWIITRQALKNAGGFEAVSRKIIPESYFARQTAKADDGYGFLCSDEKISVASRKNFDEQLATAIRTRYPQLHRRPEMVALIGLVEFGVLLAPLVLLATAAAGGIWPLAGMSALAYALEVFLYGKIVNLTYRKAVWWGFWLLPIAALQDLATLNYSMWRYEFREVIWKGRNVCIPVMRVYPAEGLEYKQ